MMVAVLLGALTLGACVDDNESQSVTDVRTAKAEQLKAMAALDRAKAEAELIYANADKALKEAQAEYQKALAAATQQEIEEAKARFAIEIERVKAEAEAAIAKQKLEAAKDEQALLDLADERVRGLYANYKTALGDLDELNSQKLTKTNYLASAEAGIISFKTQKDIEIARVQRNIDEQNFKIETYAKYEGVDKTELEQKATILYKDYQIASDITSQKNAVFMKANEAYKPNSFNAWSSEATLKTVLAVDQLRSYNYSTITETDTKLTDSKSVPYYTLNASGIESTKQRLNSDVKRLEDQIGTAKDEADQSGSSYAQIAYWTKYKADLVKDNPDADVAWIDNIIAQKNADITSDNIELGKAKARVVEFTALVASFSGDDLKAYDAAFADLKKAAEAADKASKEYQDAQAASGKANIEWQIAETLAGQNDVDALIEACKYQIALYEQQILRYKNNVTSQETLIVQYKSELETLKTQIEAQNAIIANWKAQIDAAIAAETPAE